MSCSFRVVAIIAAFNEGDIISAVIGHLVKNGIDVYLIDNHSTDDTVEQAKEWLGRGLLSIESFPDSSVGVDGSADKFDWTAILRRKEDLAAELQADWFIHHDADEIREGPWPGVSLKDAIRWVDSSGYNCIDFKVFNFVPVDNGFKRSDDPQTYFTRYEDPADFDKTQLKCWKAAKARVSLLPSGGHDVEFQDRRIFPIPFLLLHYPIRSQQHGLKKVFAERKNRLIEREHSQGWHIQYDHIAGEKYRFLRKPEELLLFDLDAARLESMMPKKTTQALVERLARTDATLVELRSQHQGLHLGLKEYREHASNLERVREEHQKRIAELEQGRGDLKAQAADLRRGLEEYRQHASNLERVREEDQKRIAELEQERGDLKAQAADLRRGLEEHRQHITNLENVRFELSEEAAKFEHELEVLKQSNRLLAGEVVGIRNSRSWRWTAPLRALFEWAVRNK